MWMPMTASTAWLVVKMPANTGLFWGFSKVIYRPVASITISCTGVYSTINQHTIRMAVLIGAIGPLNGESLLTMLYKTAVTIIDASTMRRSLPIGTKVMFTCICRRK